MHVSIKAIKFNHDSNSDTNDALTIRKNESDEIAVPEWEVNEDGVVKTSAAAYARSRQNTRTIAVRLRRHNPAVRSVAVSIQSKSILGNGIGTKPIVFSRGELSDYELVEFTSTRISSAVVGRLEIDLEWTLVATLDNGQNPTSTQRTKHVIYTLLGLPRPPWGPHDDPRDFENPWTDVLDKSCDWADGARDITEAAIRITTKLHEQAPQKLMYAQNEADSSLLFGGTDRFDCTKLLSHLSAATTPLRVNCTDCAIMVSSLANILGCDLYQSQMGYLFDTNPIRLIGVTGEKTTEFKYHEVAWEYPCDSTAKLFDCCLHVDGDSNPAGGAFDALLPVNILFGEPTDRDYHFRLVQRGRCAARPCTKKRRRVVHRTMLLDRIHPELERILKDEFDFSSWEKVPHPDRLFLGPINGISEGFLPTGWKLDRTRVLNGERDNFSMSETIWLSTTSNDTSLRVLSYKFVSVQSAREFLLNLLGGFQFPLIVRRSLSGKNSDRVIGDLAFSVPEDGVILFARSNLVVYIQNAGSSTGSVSSFARDNDLRILSMLGAEETTNLTTIQKKEKNQMFPDIVGSRWSSNRPAQEPPPNDTKPDGIFEFKEYVPSTGAVKGDYYDVKIHQTKPFEGTIKLNGIVHVFDLNHVVPAHPHKRRHYLGQVVANDGFVIVLAGQWKQVDIEGIEVSEEARKLAEAEFNGQNEGVWVATKP